MQTRMMTHAMKANQGHSVELAILFFLVMLGAAGRAAEPATGSVSPNRGQLDVRRQDYGKFIPNQSVLKTPLRIGSQAIRRGLGSHSHSEIVVRLPAPGQRFEAQVGVDHNRDTEHGRHEDADHRPEGERAHP